MSGRRVVDRDSVYSEELHVKLTVGQKKNLRAGAAICSCTVADIIRKFAERMDLELIRKFHEVVVA